MIGDEVHAQAVELVQGAHQGLRRAGKLVIAPDQRDIHLPLASHLQQGSVPGTVLPRPTGILDVLAHAQEPSTRGIFPEGEELGLRVLAFVRG